MSQKVDWVIHHVTNGVVCVYCGTVEDAFLPCACNAHTHGMERYNHPDFQLVLDVPPKELSYILNTMGLRVQNGERFKVGDMVSGIFEDCDIRLDEFEEDGRKVLRIVIPDGDNVFPDEPNCKEPYNLQALPTDQLYKKTDNPVC